MAELNIFGATFDTVNTTFEHESRVISMSEHHVSKIILLEQLINLDDKYTDY